MSDELINYIMELLEVSGGITKTRMFGGYAIRKFGLTIALFIDGEAYFKVDESNIDDYKALNSNPFTYEKKGKIITVSNWSLPIEILEDDIRLRGFVEKSYQVAIKSKEKKSKIKKGY